MSYIDDYSDKKVRALEHRLTQLYKKAHKELKQKAEGYFDNFAERYEKEYEAYQEGKYSKIEWQLWQKAQFGRGARWEKLTADMARKLKDTNKEAAKWVNDQVPAMFSENANFTAFEIEKTTMKDMGIAFNIYNEDAVKRLMLEEPDLFPKNLKINEKKDVVWNKKKLNNALTSAIVQGKTLKELADSFQHVTDMNRNSAIRNARTAMTGAQNGGRQKTFNDAVDMGIELQKEWITAGDARVRDSHAALDGVTVGNEETFPNGLRFPADPNGSPSEVYNCRCTMQAYMPKYNQKRTENTVESYREWLEEKEASVDNMGMAKNFSAGSLKVKGYKLKGFDNVYVQHYSKDTIETVNMIEKFKKNIPLLKEVDNVVILRNSSFVAAYDHGDNSLYVNSKLSDAKYIKQEVNNGYYAAKNAEETLKHEMYHKQHWDKIFSLSVSSGKDSDIIKQELENDLRKYVKEQQVHERKYIQKNISKNAQKAFNRNENLNELIADVMVLDDKKAIDDIRLIELVKEVIT